jgi:hypothetical protein
MDWRRRWLSSNGAVSWCLLALILFDAEGSRLQEVSGVWVLHFVPIFDIPLCT